MGIVRRWSRRHAALFVLGALAACGGGKSAGGGPGGTDNNNNNAGSGYVLSGNVSGVGSANAGVTVTLGGGATRTTTTAADGAYAFAALPSGTYTITPSKAGLLFDPTSLEVSVDGYDLPFQDFVASRDPAVLSAGCSMTFGPPISQTTGCSVESIAPGLDAWNFGISPTGDLVAAALDVGFSVLPATGTAYALGDADVNDAYFQVVSATTGDQWFGGKSGTNTQGTLQLTISSQTDAIVYSGKTSYRPHGQLQATVPHVYPNTVGTVSVTATF